ncbi:MAG: hypothetical protein HC886_23030, partial [Leptolyngbyaceae cyanobacterium SM1_1_3]|nr:hypothetical protein [Leptolyngbyaceae cyanobacterium SM1_1_3]
MTLLEILLLLAIAAVCGGLGQSLVGYSAGGCLASMLVGIMGAYLGLWIASTAWRKLRYLLEASLRLLGDAPSFLP